MFELWREKLGVTGVAGVNAPVPEALASRELTTV
jgi:hypothetical protein